METTKQTLRHEAARLQKQINGMINEFYQAGGSPETLNHYTRKAELDKLADTLAIIIDAINQIENLK